jgi:hypothetical protein
MEDNQKVYIRGNEKRGAEVIKILTDLGGRNSHSMDGGNVNAYYFINPNGIISNSYSCGDNVFSFVREFYKEIKLLRWKPKYKESYYCISWEGRVVDDTWTDTQDEKICYEFGNCFKTYDEAKAASYKIQEILNK